MSGDMCGLLVGGVGILLFLIAWFPVLAFLGGPYMPFNWFMGLWFGAALLFLVLLAFIVAPAMCL